jgi:DNA-binding CsgD family transcriptional regulator
MVVCIIDSLRRKIFASQKQAALMASVVFGNIAVWFVEKFVPWDFEFLAVSYLFSEIILLAVHWMMQDYVHINQTSHASLENTVEVFDIQTASIEQKVSKIVSSLSEEEELSSREREMLELILQNKKRKDIADELHLSENTVKTHTRTLYAKLGVGSRDELNELLQK